MNKENNDFIRRSDVLMLLQTYNESKLKETGNTCEDMTAITEIIRECPATLNRNGVVVKTTEAVVNLQQNIKQMWKKVK